MLKSPAKLGYARSALSATVRSLRTRILGLTAPPDSVLSDEARVRGGGHSARRINALARELGATRYLEIGVFRGVTFSGVQIPKKTAVDRHFQFDWRTRSSDLVRFYEMKSDDWFTKYGAGETFDIIFLDGLHTFEQTFRDFCNSLLLSHDQTVWLIDDTMPSDIYSSCPHFQQAVELRRKEMGRYSTDRRLGGWSGDVYKLVFAIHDFFPMLSYRTILPPGNPQTIVWRRPRPDFAPVFNNLEAISRLSYFELQSRVDLLRGASESEVLQVVFSSLARPV